MPKSATAPLSNDWDRSGLPAWSYFSDDLLEAEKEALFRCHWQLVCHVGDLGEPGDYIAVDFVGERALVVRGKDGEVRAFHNLCRHRGSRVVADDRGHCRSSIICPFHGWVYNLDGTLRGASQPNSLPDLDPVEWGLKPLETDIWQGFVFVRFKPGPQPAISKVMARFDKELAQYDIPAMLPDGGGFWQEQIRANWKCVRDVDNEGYHVPKAHPGLDDLFGGNYADEPFQGGASRSFAPFREDRSTLWSVRNYKKLLPDRETLDAEHKRAWLYIGLFPNTAFGIYPDSVIFYNEFPDGHGKTIQRGAIYRNPVEDRRLRAARYLSRRIDRITGKEDEQLIEWSWEAAQSSGYDGVILSDLEIGVKSYHDELRRHFPVLDHDEPEYGRLAEVNALLLRAGDSRG
ncbi:MAG: aromatic ring-hydroxylating dioxygenase subunit alpha [Pseudooceanicola sp.]|nr:aromatic ring-hydroxylating dioxygenase subunit alpha [Pseudooceanicola sp.]